MTGVTISRESTWLVGALLASLFSITPMIIVSGMRPAIFAIILVCLLLISTRTGGMKYLLLYGLLVLTFFFTSAFHGLLTETVENILYPIILLISTALVFSATHTSIILLLRVSTAILFVVLVGSVVAFIWGGMGLPAIGFFENPDGRTNYIFPFSLSNSIHNGVIRPSGIFDEPGALSFFVCAVAFTRHILGEKKYATWTLLILGLVTLSLAHLSYMVFHFMSENSRVKVRIAILGLVFLAFSSFVISLTGYSDALNDRFINRLYHPELGFFFGAEGRLELHNNAVSYIDSIQSFLFGRADTALPYNSTPFSPIVERGFLVVWPHYSVMILALFLSLIMLIKGNPIGFVIIGFYALFLQRPAVMATAYSFWAVLPIFILYNKSLRVAVRDRGNPPNNWWFS